MHEEEIKIENSQDPLTNRVKELQDMLARDGGSIRNVLSEVTSINLKIKVIEDLIKTQLTAGIKQTLKSLLDKNVFKK